MYESQDFFDDKITKATTLTRTFYFSNPTAVHKLKLDNIEGSVDVQDYLTFKVEFLGLDRTRRNQIGDPFSGGTVFKRKRKVKKDLSKVLFQGKNGRVQVK